MIPGKQKYISLLISPKRLPIPEHYPSNSPFSYRLCTIAASFQIWIPNIHFPNAITAYTPSALELNLMITVNPVGKVLVQVRAVFFEIVESVFQVQLQWMVEASFPCQTAYIKFPFDRVSSRAYAFHLKSEMSWYRSGGNSGGYRFSFPPSPKIFGLPAKRFPPPAGPPLSTGPKPFPPSPGPPWPPP